MDSRMTELLAAIVDHSGLDREDIRQAGEHGADAGWAGFTYTSDGADFTRSNRDLVWTLLAEEAESFGFENVAAFVASFNRSDMADDAMGFDCLLAWWALETCGRWIEDNASELRREDEDALETSGEAAGRAAGSWVTDGNSSDADRLAVIRAAEDCELDIPSPLSGEWADGWTEDRVFEDAGVTMPEDDDARAELLSVWEDAFRDGFESQAVADARGSLSVAEHGCDRCGSIGPELFHNDASGLSLCEDCDLAEDDASEPRDLRKLASEYHSGQASALYAYASSGSLVDGLAAEARACLAIAAEHGEEDAMRELLTIAEAAEDARAERHERNERALTRAFGEPGSVTRVELPEEDA